MPTTYAHWRFGCDCIETLPEELKKIIRDNRELYDIGVHGPDIFFYDLKHDEVAKFGQKMHFLPGKDFFNKVIEVYKNYDSDKDAMLSYILGFLSHYALDSQCHTYINKKDYETENLSHNKIESEYDSHMMRLDGKTASQINRAKSLKPDDHTSAIISRFFPFTSEEMKYTTKGQKRIISALNCRTSLKRVGLEKLLKKMNRFDYADLIVQVKEDERCKASNLRIDKLRNYALQVYPILASNICNVINNNGELLPYFNRIFDPVGDENTPILSYQEELDYIPIKDIE